MQSWYCRAWCRGSWHVGCSGDGCDREHARSCHLAPKRRCIAAADNGSYTGEQDAASEEGPSSSLLLIGCIHRPCRTWDQWREIYGVSYTHGGVYTSLLHEYMYIPTEGCHSVAACTPCKPILNTVLLQKICATKYLRGPKVFCGIKI